MTQDWPPRLTIEPEPVFELFTGESFYSSADAAIREAVLNSIDAIGRRKGLDPSLDPEIEIVFDTENKTITVTDNGEGMGKRDLTDLFTKTGASAAQLAAGSHYRAVGEFGIGALSYFLVSEAYEIDTMREGHEPVGLIFSRTMRDGRTRSQEKETSRNTVGTTVTMNVESLKLLNLCIDKFSHWMRSVEGLTGRVVPEGKTLSQGGLTRKVRKIEIADPPDWIEGTELGPPEDLGIWDRYDGKSQIDVLYRGVFVERVEIPQLWGLDGAVHVDPKHFRPMLNREGFVGDKLRSEVTPFLQQVHPTILEKAVDCIHDLLAANDNWSLNKAITLWLAVPRTDKYAAATKVWDEEFKTRQAFRLLGQTGEQSVSVVDIINLGADKIYLAPDQVNKAMPVIRQAIRVLRGRGSKVIQGYQRDQNYLATIAMPSQFSSWLLLTAFKDQLPEITKIETVADKLVGQESLSDVYLTAPAVKLVELGTDSSAFLAVGNEIWINIENVAGSNILSELCKRNEGHLGLWAACMMHAPGAGLDQVGNLLKNREGEIERLGLVRRQYLRTFLK